MERVWFVDVVCVRIVWLCCLEYSVILYTVDLVPVWIGLDSRIDGITIYLFASSNRAAVIAAHQVRLARRRRPRISPSSELELYRIYFFTFSCLLAENTPSVTPSNNLARSLRYCKCVIVTPDAFRVPLDHLSTTPGIPTPCHMLRGSRLTSMVFSNYLYALPRWEMALRPQQRV